MNIINGDDPCRGKSWKIVLDRLDLEKRTFTIMQSVIVPPLKLPDGEGLLDAYDPDIIEFGNFYWVAFECAGEHIPGTSICVASLTLSSDLQMLVNDIYVAINGELSGIGEQYAAADPKFLTFRGRLYLYWTAIEKHDNAWVSLSTRGTEVELSGRPQRLWPNGTSHAASSFDTTNSQVWPDADVFSVREVGGTIYATAGSAGKGCLTPSTELEGCFRLLISRSASPLGQNALSRDIAPVDQLPTTGQEYARFFSSPDGRMMIMGHFVPHKSEWFQQRPVPVGLTAFPIDLKRLFHDLPPE